MVTSQPPRSGTVQAWWAHTGSTNRGFVSLDPERQREVDSGRKERRKSMPNEFAFDVQGAGAPARPAGAANRAKRGTPGEPAGAGKRRADSGGSRR